MGKVNQLGGGSEIEAAYILAQSGEGELRGAGVRGNDRIIRILQNLEPLYPGAGRIAARVPPRPGVGHEPLARQRRLGSDVDACREVAEIVVVRHLVQVEYTEKRSSVIVSADEAQRRTTRVGGAVTRQVLGLELAVVVLRQIAELLGDLQSALFHVARCEREVVVGREVQVVRSGELGSALAGGADRRNQEAGLSAVVE